MIMSTEANKNEGTETKAILQELDELMDYIDADDNSENEELIDPAFFIGNINEGIPDVPTLTTVANEPVAERPKKDQPETSRQPGLFSARVERFKQGAPVESEVKPEVEVEAKIEPKAVEEAQVVEANQAVSNNIETLSTHASDNDQTSEEELNHMVDALVEEQLPKLEAQLRERILVSIQNKKEF